MEVQDEIMVVQEEFVVPKMIVELLCLKLF